MPTLSKLVSASQTHDARTYNGAITNSTSQSQLVDLFFIAGTLIGKEPSSYMRKWHGAYMENPELAIKLLFRMRDVRGGAGVRDAFNYIYNQLTPEERKHFAHYIPEYGRRKDVFELAEQDFEPFKEFIMYSIKQGPAEPSFGLFCKWFPRKGKIFNKVQKELECSPRALRKLIVGGSNTVEQKMSSNAWSKILYEHVPSKAFAKYQKAFERHDYTRFNEFVNKKPELIKSTTLFPCDIYKEFKDGKDEKVIEAQWKNLPDYIQSEKTFLPIIDISGSMFSSSSSRETGITPIMNSISLGLYLAERNKSIFKNAFISFSEKPAMHYIEGESVCSKFKYIGCDPTMGYSTNLQASFDLILTTALENKLTRDDLPDYVLVMSDMEFNVATEGWGRRETNFEEIKRKFRMNNLEMPKLVFWNLDGRIGNVPVTINDQGTALVSGYSPAIMKSVLTSNVVTPYDVMMEVLSSDRYKDIK